LNKDKNFYFKKLVNEKKFEELFLIILKIIENEVELTHSNIECKTASILYDYIILCCLYYFEENNNSNDNDLNFNFNENENENDTSIILFKITQFFEALLKSNNSKISKYKNSIENIQRVFDEINNFSNFESGIKSKLISEIGIRNIGFYLYAFRIIFFVLRFYQEFLSISKNKKENLYTNIMFFICNLGGDTDTNCCIAGGVIGALVKMENINDHYLNPHVLFCTEGESTNTKRWIIYSPIYLGYYAIRLLDIMENPKDRKE
jgi:hypothetical protein